MISKCTDGDLLAILTGDERLLSYRGSLTTLCYPKHHETAHPRLAAALELSQRVLLEELYRQDAIAAPGDALRYLKMHYKELPREVFTILLLDAQNRIVHVEDVFLGTLVETSVYPREVIRLAFEYRAASLIAAHNHPSGVAEPSRADIRITELLKKALALVDIRLLDHFVVAGSTHVSLSERGLL